MCCSKDTIEVRAGMKFIKVMNTNYLELNSKFCDLYLEYSLYVIKQFLIMPLALL